MESLIRSCVVFMLVFMFVFGLVISPLVAYQTVEEKSFCVESKERVVSQDSSKYLIFTEDEVLENVDTIWHLKFNSSDIYGQLKEGECYTAKVNWFRIPFLSAYRNILTVK